MKENAHLALLGSTQALRYILLGENAQIIINW